MISVILFWVIPAVLCCALIVLGFWWEKKTKGHVKVSVADVFGCACFVLCPILNILATCALICWFFTEVAPNIILFGKNRP